MNKLKAFIHDINEVPEEHRGLYVEETDDKGNRTGRWKLDAEGVEDVTALRNAHERQKKENKELREQAERFRNINPEEYQRLQREAQDRQQREEQIQREAEDRIREATDAHQREAKALRDQIQALTTRLHDLFVQTELDPAIREAKGEPILLLPHMRQRVRVKDEKGVLKLEVLNGEGGVMLGKDGKPAAIKDLVTEFQESERFSRAFDGVNASGSGAGGQHGGSNRKGGGPNPFAKGHWNKTDQGALLRENRDAATAAAIEAGFRSLEEALRATGPKA